MNAPRCETPDYSDCVRNLHEYLAIIDRVARSEDRRRRDLQAVAQFLKHTAETLEQRELHFSRAPIENQKI